MKFKSEVFIFHRLCQLAADDYLSSESLLIDLVKELEKTKRHPKGVMIQSLIVNTQLTALETTMLISKRYITTYLDFKNFLEAKKTLASTSADKKLAEQVLARPYLEGIYNSAEKAMIAAEHKHNLIPKKSYSVKENMDVEQHLDSIKKLHKCIYQWCSVRNNSETGIISNILSNLNQIINYISTTE